MSFFSEIRKAAFQGFASGRMEAKEEAALKRLQREVDGDDTRFPVEKTSNSVGRVVELRVTSRDGVISNSFMVLLKDYAEVLKKNGVTYTVRDKTIRMVFPNEKMAEEARNGWR